MQLFCVWKKLSRPNEVWTHLTDDAPRHLHAWFDKIEIDGSKCFQKPPVSLSFDTAEGWGACRNWFGNRFGFTFRILLSGLSENWYSLLSILRKDPEIRLPYTNGWDGQRSFGWWLWAWLWPGAEDSRPQRRWSTAAIRGHPEMASGVPLEDVYRRCWHQKSVIWYSAYEGIAVVIMVCRTKRSPLRR